MHVQKAVRGCARVCVVLLALCTASAEARAGSCPPACGTPASAEDSPRAIDCLFILRAAVGSAACYPECICRLTSGDSIRVTDALRCLRSAVSGAVPACACESVTTTTLPAPTGTCGVSGAECHSLFDCREECFGSCLGTWDGCMDVAREAYEACLSCVPGLENCPSNCLLRFYVAENGCDDRYFDCSAPCEDELCEGLHDGPRFEDTGLTVIDHQTRLEWEKKTAGNYSLLYTWSSDYLETEPNGTVFTRLLAEMNDCRSETGCYAGHCDWRLPTMAPDPRRARHAELESLQKVVFCPRALEDCEDPVFGPVFGRRRYWSATENEEKTGAWTAFFSATYPRTSEMPKWWLETARAVRSVR